MCVLCLHIADCCRRRRRKSRNNLFIHFCADACTHPLRPPAEFYTINFISSEMNDMPSIKNEMNNNIKEKMMGNILDSHFANKRDLR